MIKKITIRVVSAGLINTALCIEILRVVPKSSSFFIFVLGFIYPFLIATTIEWMVHKYIYHHKFPILLSHIYKIHQYIHHIKQFPTNNYVNKGPQTSVTMDAKITTNTNELTYIYFLHLGFYMSFGTILIITSITSNSILFVILNAFWSLIFSDLFIRVHDTIHRPGTYPWIESQIWFDFIDNHHWIHHVDNSCNLNFLLPLFDLQVGTIRFKTTHDENNKHGFLVDAKK